MRAAFQLPGYDGFVWLLAGSVFSHRHFAPGSFTSDHPPQVGRPTTSPNGRHFRQVQLVSSPEWFHMLAVSKALYTCIHTA